MAKITRVQELMSEAMEMLCRRVLAPNAEEWLEAVIALLRNERPQDAVVLPPSDGRSTLDPPGEQVFTLTFGDFNDLHALAMAATNSETVGYANSVLALSGVVMSATVATVGMRMMRLSRLNDLAPPDYESIVRQIEAVGHRRCPQETVFRIGFSLPDLHIGERAYIVCDAIVLNDKKYVPYVERLEKSRYLVAAVAVTDQRLLSADARLIVVD